MQIFLLLLIPDISTCHNPQWTSVPSELRLTAFQAGDEFTGFSLWP